MAVKKEYHPLLVRSHADGRPSTAAEVCPPGRPYPDLQIPCLSSLCYQGAKVTVSCSRLRGNCPLRKRSSWCSRAESGQAAWVQIQDFYLGQLG